MLTIIHAIFDMVLFLTIGKFTPINTTILDLLLILSVNLIDLDHIKAKPIFKKGRNSFKTHFIHKKWKIIILLASIMLFIRPLLFLGIGLISHLTLDHLDNIIHKA